MRKDALLFFLEALVLAAAFLWLTNSDKWAGVSLRNARPIVSPPRVRSDSASVDASASANYKDIAPEEAWRRMRAGEKVVVLDVRTPEEYKQGHIPGGVLLPVQPRDEITPNAARVLPDRDAAIFVYCRSGVRSVEAAKILVGLGYRNVFNLGGINSWPYEKE